MALDTANKRASALGLFLTVLAHVPLPDLTIGTEDFPQILGFYSGITTDEPPVYSNQGTFFLIISN